MPPKLRPRPTLKLTAEDRGWLAGIIEGEGCFTTAKQGEQIVFWLSSTDKDVVQRVQQLLGFGNVRQIPDHYTRLGTKPVWRIQAGARNEVLALMDEIYPLMGARRQARIDELRGS